jgi:nucleolar protein 53
MAPAVSDPHRGTSYNPPQDAYTELLEMAIQAEQKQVAEEDKHIVIKEAIEAARRVLHIDVPRGAVGMTIDTPMGDTAEDPVNGEGEEVIEVVPANILTRKTKQQRRKARKVLAEVRERLVGG